MKTNLNVFERVTLMGMLPQENNFLTLKLIRELTSKLGLSDEELKEFGVNIDKESGSVTWNKKGAEGIEMEFSEKEVELITDSLKELDKQKKLHQKHFDLYEKFIQ